MEEKYIRYSKTLKALADPKRLRIVDMLSCGELCACRILEEFNVTQPTLSHDMQVLSESGLINARRDGKWAYYSLNIENLNAFYQEFKVLISDKPDCICHKNKTNKFKCSE